MRYNYFILFFLILLLVPKTNTAANIYFVDNKGVIIDSSSFSTSNIDLYSEMNDKRPNPILQLIKKQQRKNKRTVAAILAFPFPFGIVGLHRIYLGTAPHVPIVYIGTFGGVLGILPFIDFCVLILDKDIDRYQNNHKIFMWVN